MCEQIHRVCVVLEGGLIYNAKSMQLMPKSSLPNNELGSVCSVQTVNAVGPCNSFLNQRLRRASVPVLEEASRSHNFVRN